MDGEIFDDGRVGLVSSTSFYRIVRDLLAIHVCFKTCYARDRASGISGLRLISEHELSTTIDQDFVAAPPSPLSQFSIGIAPSRYALLGVDR